MQHGWIILDKPSGMSSAQTTHKIQRLTKSGKAGHWGTLDPLATGMLPIALGEATKTIPYASNTDKVYQFQLTWGEARTTDDAEGEVITRSSNRPTREAIMRTLPHFMGNILQVPPLYSAVKINGQRAYRLARQGKQDTITFTEQKQRSVCIHHFTLQEINNPDQATFLVSCGSGTYIRSLVRDLAAKLGTCGYVNALRRLSVGKFNAPSMISLEKVSILAHKLKWNQFILPMGAVLDDIPAVSLSVDDAFKIRRGIKVSAPSTKEPQVSLWLENELIAIAEIHEGWLCPRRVFNH